MSASFPLLTIPAELQLEITTFLPWWDLHSLRLTNHHFSSLINPAKARYIRPVYFDSYAGDEILEIEESTWAHDNDLWYCDGCWELLPRYCYNHTFKESRKSEKWRREGWYVDYFRFCGLCGQHGYPNRPDGHPEPITSRYEFYIRGRKIRRNIKRPHSNPDPTNPDINTQ